MKTEMRVMGVLLAVTLAATAAMRSWTFERSGKTIQGEVVGFSGGMVDLKCPDGTTYSVPIAYLSEGDRVELAAERAKQWKEVEVTKLVGTASAGRYKKCDVAGTDVNGEILIDLLPASIEAILNNRNQQEAQINALKAWIDADTAALTRSGELSQDPNHPNVYVPVPSLFFFNNAAQARYEEAQANLARLEAAYTDSVNQTRAETIVKMKNTGLIYDGLPVWECFDPRKPEQ